MPLNSIADITISLQAAASARPGFGIPAVFTPVTSPQEAAFGSDYAKVVTEADWQSVLLSLEFTTASDAYIAMSDLFAQERKPDYALIVRRATAVAQVNDYTVGGTDDGEYVISLDGQDASFTASGNTAEEIRDGLDAAIALLSNASDFTTADVSTDGLSVTAAFAGLPFASDVESPNDNLTEVATTASVGPAQDVANLRAERDDWYAVIDVTHEDGNIRAFADVIETLNKIFGAQSSTAAILTSATTDVISLLKAETLVRTFVVYSSDDSQYVEAAWLGQMLPSDPGSENWAYQTLASVTGDEITPSGELNLLAKNACWLENFAALGVSTTRQGITPGGQYLDVIRGRDWLDANMQIDIFDALRVNPKIPYTDEGGEILGAVVRSRLEQGADAGLVDRDSIVVNVPRKSAQTATDISDRLFDGITFEAVLTGAINSVKVTGSLVP